MTDYEPFAIPGIDVQLWRWTGAPRANVPVVDPGYEFREDHVRELATCVWPSDNGPWMPLLASGPKGAGKTSLVLQVAAHCRQPVYRCNLNVGTSVRHLKGRVGALDGATVFVPGVATLAMEHGAWLLLDEVTGATPPVALSLFPLLEPDGDVLLEDAQPPRYVRRHPAFRVMATDNTVGADMEASKFEYSGTNQNMNGALLDRFGGMIHVNYLSAEAEHRAIMAKVPDVDPLVLEGLIKAANHMRSTVELPGFSTRMLLAWARRVALGVRGADGSQRLGGDYQVSTEWIVKCAHPAFLDRQRSLVERDAMLEVIQRQFA